ncbi:hypothetical protein FW774_13840 [Pedobacter sp. BS3]|uniref:hypothetical protein n=1 Tax=Pedobacter sp. BS3 TaxID=2567937 RepID=UPI0011EFEBBE|nr:hypothetical protein [Pedobacter sp. BS3]TZF82586.1 hypothetical protein FW774_13840 [Pedobacter sp. BS3]
MAHSFQFYIHHNGRKELCNITVNDDNYDVYFDDKFITHLRYDHHGKWYRLGGEELPEETVEKIGDGIDSYLLSGGG